MTASRLTRRFLPLLTAASCLAVSLLPALAAPPRPLPPSSAAGANLINGDGWTLLQPAQQPALLSLVNDVGPDGVRAKLLKVVVASPAPLIYSIQLTQDLAFPIAADHLLRYSFWVKADSTHTLRAVIEKNTPPYPMLLGGVSLKLTPRWTEYSYTATPGALAARTCGARLQIGLESGEVEFADVTVRDMGLDPAIARDAAALAPAAIQTRIRKYRMADLTVRVVDRRGRPVPRAQVAVRQQRHAFLFGCDIFGLRDINQSSSAPADWQSQKTYRDRFAALFNYATLPFYWGAFEQQAGQPDFPRLSWMARWCRQRGIATKAHPLVWQEVYPYWAPAEPDQAIPLLHKRVDDIVARMSGLSTYYDAINETMDAPTYTPANGESRWVARDGAASVTQTVLGWARSAAAANDANDKFIVNDYIVDDNYAALFRQLQSRGSMPDAIGIQAHMHAGVWPMRRVWDTCQRFSPFGVPVHITETTVLSSLTPHAMDANGPPATDWPSTPAGEAAQADYVAQFYTVLFSHPSVRAITWWDLSDHDAWLGAPAGLLRRDMSPKPAYDRLLALVKHAWWTNAAGRASSTGRYQVRAYYGEYFVTATDSRGRTVTKFLDMPEASGPSSITLILP